MLPSEFFESLSRSLWLYLSATWAEWTTLPGHTLTGASWQTFMDAMQSMSVESHLRPECMDHACLFGNYWTV